MTQTCSTETIRRILVINLGGIGDLILSSPALRAMRIHFPSARIELLAVQRSADIMELYHLFDALHVYPEKSALRLALQLYRLRKNRYDLLINMRTMVGLRGAAKMLLLVSLIHAKLNAGRNTDGYGAFFDFKIRETLAGHKPETAYDIDLAHAIGIPVTDTRPYLPIDDADRAAVSSLLKSHGISAGDFLIAINPGGVPSHRWPLDNYSTLLQQLMNTFACKIIITGSSAEQELASLISKKAGLPGIISCAGKTTVRQAAALLQRMHMVITNDTGPVHICTALGIPGIFLFGGGNHRRYAAVPPGNRHIVITRKASCSPCEKRICKNNHCMTGISVDEVYRAVLDLKRILYA